MASDDYRGLCMFWRRLHLMVAVMHQRGYEDMWLLPYRRGAGHYRLQLAAGEQIGDDPLRASCDTAFLYSSAYGYDWCGQDDLAGDTPEQLADKLTERFPDFVARCHRPNPEYAAWLKTVLAASEPDGLFLLDDGNRYPEPEAPFYWWPQARWDGVYQLLPPLPASRGK